MTQLIDAIRMATKKAWARRFHTHPVIREETIGHHMNGVSILCILVYPDHTLNMLQYAAIHDLAEGEFGDLPAYTKIKLGIRDAVHKLEAEYLERFGVIVPELTAEEKRRMRFLDHAHGALRCQMELRCGNVEIKDVLEGYLHSLCTMELLTPNEGELFNMITGEMN